MYTSSDEKPTFNIANENNTVQCESASNVQSGKICSNLGQMTYVRTLGEQSIEEVFSLLLTSNNKFKIASDYHNRYLYASNGDVTAVAAYPDASDENLLWTFERCDVGISLT